MVKYFALLLISRGVFEGIPVLFIPGNGGSYKQVRSMGSVALRMFQSMEKTSNYFNFFAVDLNEVSNFPYLHLNWKIV